MDEMFMDELIVKYKVATVLGKKRTGKKRSGMKRTGKEATGKKRTRKKAPVEKSALGKKRRYNFIYRSKLLFTAEFLSHITFNIKKCVI